MKSTICLNDNNEVTTIQGESEPTKSVGDRRPKKRGDFYERSESPSGGIRISLLSSANRKGNLNPILYGIFNKY